VRPIVTLSVLAALLSGLAIAVNPPAALAAVQDGNWSVLIITEKGDCDRAYRYSVAVSNGQVRYAGDAAVKLNGTVTSSGVVKVSLMLGDKGASGSGRLSASSGVGTWRGVGANTSCAGRWEAERR
jgi:hypothetical protein